MSLVEESAKYMTQLSQIKCVRPQIINDNPVQVHYH